MKRTNRASPEESEVEEEEETGSSHIPYMQLRNFFKDLLSECPDRLKNLRYSTDLGKIIDGHPAFNKYKNLIHDPNLKSYINTVLSQATKRSHLSMYQIASLIETFVESGDAVSYFEGFPGAPRRPLDLYVEAKRGDARTVQDLGRIRAQFPTADDRHVYEEQAQEAKAAFAKMLRNFLDQHCNELLPEHVVYCQQKISLYESKRSKKAKVVKDAFYYFRQATLPDVEDLPEDKREKVLTKRFRKLAPEELRIYENIAKAR